MKCFKKNTDEINTCKAVYQLSKMKQHKGKT